MVVIVEIEFVEKLVGVILVENTDVPEDVVVSPRSVTAAVSVPRIGEIGVVWLR